MIQAIVFLPLIGAILAGLISIVGAHSRNPSGDTVEHHDDAHGDAHGHGGEALGPIDWRAWGAAALGIASAAVVVAVLYVTIRPAA